jgi:hypothetical protein
VKISLSQLHYGLLPAACSHFEDNMTYDENETSRKYNRFSIYPIHFFWTELPIQKSSYKCTLHELLNILILCTCQQLQWSKWLIANSYFPWWTSVLSSLVYVNLITIAQKVQQMRTMKIWTICYTLCTSSQYQMLTV